MKTCLYITYDGLLDPLGQSQILPYIKNLNNKGYEFIIISYEKTKNQKRIKNFKKELKNLSIYWKPFIFRKSKINFIYRFIIGAIYINYIQNKREIDLIHLRGGYSALIYLLSFSKKKYLYDLRAFWGQWAEGGRTQKNSFVYKILIKLEKIIIKNAEGIIVLDESGKYFINKNFNYNKPLKVISTSTNIEKYQIKENSKKDYIRFVYLGGASYPPYKIKNTIILLNALVKFGYKCSLDFINKNEHNIIKDILNKEKVDKIKINLRSLDHEEIFETLPNYDVGLVFLEKGKWLRMSSPTKIGEYLAAGLGIIGNKGIAVLDRLSKESNCVETIEIDSDNFHMTDKVNKFLLYINGINFRKECQQLAQKYFSLKKANKKYLSIYRKILDKT